MIAVQNTYQPALDGESRFRSLLADGLRRAQRLRRPVLVSTTVEIPAVDPLAVYAAGAGASERRLWSCPSLGYELAGVGSAWSVEAAGPERFAAARRAWAALCADAIIADAPPAPGGGPLLMGGFTFDTQRPRSALWREFPDALLTVPRVLVARLGDACYLTLSAVAQPDRQPERGAEMPVAQLLWRAAAARLSPAAPGQLEAADVLPAGEWTDIVRAAIAEMEGPAAGRSERPIEKVVLARECRVSAPHALDRPAALARLRADYPGCFIFAVDRGAACFLGASPERLVRVQRGELQAACLAGSIARGATPAEDQRLGQALLDSGKDRREHMLVVRGMTEALRDVVDDLAVPPEPALMLMRNVQHLHTPVTGRVREGSSVLDLVERLHPTPAVGGLPRAAAMALIRGVERLDRGWYAAPVGWVDSRGDGEFAVALRSGLLRGSEATLFAGCGIVPGSNPEQEYAESRLKLRPMLAALGGAQ